MRFNETLRMLREQRGITQEDLAKYLNMTKHAISKYELGERTPDPEVVLKLANYFGVTTDFLLGNDIILKNIENDPDLLAFWTSLQQNEQLRLLARRLGKATPRDIRRLLRIIQAIEEEEERE